jgi:integrase
LKPFLTEAWRVAWQWAAAEPATLRTPLPRSLLRAMVGAAILWEWPIFAGLLVLGFTCFLRPSELLSARRKDLSLPSDRLEISGDVFLRVATPKTWRAYPVQHARCSDQSVVPFIERLFRALPPSAPLSPYSSSAFRARWDRILVGLGVPHTIAELGVTPGSLRGSGATDFYMATEDVPRTFWRGRWKRASTAERYLQAAAASSLLAGLPHTSRDRIQQLANASDRLVSFWLSSSSSNWPASLSGARPG